MVQYARLVSETDLLVARLVKRYRRHLCCRPGCDACCRHDLSVFAVEAAAVRQALAALREPVRSIVIRQAEGEPAYCPILVAGQCVIYRARPLICRTQGLPLLIEGDDGSQTVDFCPLNFTESGATEDLDREYLVDLEDLNSKLVRANRSYCLRRGLEPGAAGLRLRMSDILKDMQWIR